VGATLDGTWSYEDTRAAYVPVGRPENRHQAVEVGAFLLEDILHWALARKNPHRQALIIIDEFSKLSDRPGAAVDLVERARSFSVAVVLIAQTWASLGPDDTIRNRLAGTVGTVIAHQLKQPDDVAALAGTEWVLERTEQTHTLDHTGLGSQRAGNRFLVHPDDIRRLHQGEAFIIHSGEALKLRVRPPRQAPPAANTVPADTTHDGRIASWHGRPSSA
jgi:type IV secretory pathway TraG/TraD family ATPase VirD4